MELFVPVFALIALLSLIDLHAAIWAALYKTSCWMLLRNRLFRKAFRRTSPWGFWSFQVFTAVYALAVAAVCTGAGALLLLDGPAKVFSNITLGFITNGMRWADQIGDDNLRLAVCSAAFALTWWFPQILRKADTKTTGTPELSPLMRFLLSYQLIRRWVFVNLLFFHREQNPADVQASANKVPAIHAFASALLQEYRDEYPSALLDKVLKRVGRELQVEEGAGPNQLFFEVIKAYGARYLYELLERRKRCRVDTTPVAIELSNSPTTRPIEVQVCNMTVIGTFLKRVGGIGFCNDSSEECPSGTLHVGAISSHPIPSGKQVEIRVAITPEPEHHYLEPARRADARALWRLLKPYRSALRTT